MVKKYLYQSNPNELVKKLLKTFIWRWNDKIYGYNIEVQKNWHCIKTWSRHTLQWMWRYFEQIWWPHNTLQDYLTHVLLKKFQILHKMFPNQLIFVNFMYEHLALFEK